MRGCCVECGYPLKGMTMNICPEWGPAFADNTRTETAARDNGWAEPIIREKGGGMRGWRGERGRGVPGPHIPPLFTVTGHGKLADPENDEPARRRAPGNHSLGEDRG